MVTHPGEWFVTAAFLAWVLLLLWLWALWVRRDLVGGERCYRRITDY